MDIKKSVQHIEISEERGGQRLDNWLFTIAKGVPKSRIYRAIRKGEVRINKKRAKSEYKLHPGDIVRIPPLHTQISAVFHIKTSTTDWLMSRILYEDKNLLVVNKPSGLAVHGGSKISFGIIDILRRARTDETLELVHRLDRDTSGCLLIAKNRIILQQLHDLLRNNKIEKEYLCLVKGRFQEAKQIVKLPLRKNTLQSGERIVQVDKEGKMAITEFNVINATETTSLLQVKLHTGRMHQIRVHLQQIHHPIAGDAKYGNRGFNKQMHAIGLKRLFLHAEKLKFRLPDAAKAIRVLAPLEEDLQECWNHLKQTAVITN